MHVPSLAHLDDLILSGEDNPKFAYQEQAGGNDLKEYVHRTILDAYTTADRLNEASTVKDNGVGYPSSDLASQLRLVARLLKADFSTRVYYVEQGGYDTHSTQLVTHAQLLDELSNALRAFLDDLGSAGLAERVAVMTFSEFGRRVAENGSYGTDHGTAAPVFLAGPCVKSGLVGTTPSLMDLDPEHGDLKTAIDFRQVYATVLQDWLDLPAKEALAGSFERLPLFQS